MTPGMMVRIAFLSATGGVATLAVMVLIVIGIRPMHLIGLSPS